MVFGIVVLLGMAVIFYHAGKEDKPADKVGLFAVGLLAGVAGGACLYTSALGEIGSPFNMDTGAIYKLHGQISAPGKDVVVIETGDATSTPL